MFQPVLPSPSDLPTGKQEAWNSPHENSLLLHLLWQSLGKNLQALDLPGTHAWHNKIGHYTNNITMLRHGFLSKI